MARIELDGGDCRTAHDDDALFVLLEKLLNHVDNLLICEHYKTLKKLAEGIFSYNVIEAVTKFLCFHRLKNCVTGCHSRIQENSPKRKEEKGLSLKIDFYLELLVLSCPGLRRCSFHGRRSLSGCRKLEAGIPWVPSSSSLLPAPSRKSIHPTTVVDRHKQQRRRLVDLLRHINMLWAKGARSSGRALRDAPGPAPHGHGAISGQILYRRACSQFSMRSKWSSSVQEALLEVAPPAIMCQPEALVVQQAGRQATARQDNKKRPWKRSP